MKDIEMFAKKALVLGHRAKTWDFYEIAATSFSDIKNQARLTLKGNCASDFTTRRFVGPPRYIIDLADDDGDYYIAVDYDDVICFLFSNQIPMVVDEINHAYQIYEQSPSQESWDVFEVTVRLLVSDFN